MAIPTKARATVSFTMVAVALLSLLARCTPATDAQTEAARNTSSDLPTPGSDENGKAWFREAEQEAGLLFLHQHGGTGEKYFIETMGGGGGFLDYDNDGWLDVYLVQSAPLPGASNQAFSPNRLFRNQGNGTFVDVTSEAGVGDTGYGMGASFGDYDNDGYADIFVTNFGPNQLYRNNGDGTFTNVTERAGVGDERWGTSTAFADYDQDGDLDLYVVNYVTYSMDQNIRCGPKDILAYCHPDVYRGSPDLLYRNNGDGTFTDVTREAGVFVDAPNESKGLGVVWLDYDNDGNLDIYVANDSNPNFLYRNNGDGTFTDVALETGAAYNRDGHTEAGMGVTVGDYNWDGYLDLFITHLNEETNTLYHNIGGRIFQDYTTRVNLGIPSLKQVGFGTGFFDFDNDGWLDLFIANGHILEAIERLQPGSGVTYAQRNKLYQNDRSRGFRDVSERAGAHFLRQQVSRGAAVGDIDNDGDLDILVINNHQKATLLINRVGEENDWIGFKLRGRSSNRDAIGARVEVKVGQQTRWKEVHSGGSYLSQHDLRVVFGLNDAERPSEIRIRWPSGARQDLDAAALLLNTYHDVQEDTASQ